MIKIKRVYSAFEKGDGTRILIDRLWPRGVRKEGAKIDLWLKELGPSTELRLWFNHEPLKFEEFRKRYVAELENKVELVDRLLAISRRETLTLLYAAKDESHNNAVILKEYLDSITRAG